LNMQHTKAERLLNMQHTKAERLLNMQHTKAERLMNMQHTKAERLRNAQQYKERCTSKNTKAKRLMNMQHTKVEGFVNIASQLLNQSTSKGLVIDSNLTIELISKLFIQQMECRCVCVSLLNDFSHERMSIFAYMSFKM